MKKLSRRKVLRGMLRGSAVTVGLPVLSAFLNETVSEYFVGPSSGVYSFSPKGQNILGAWASRLWGVPSAKMRPWAMIMAREQTASTSSRIWVEMMIALSLDISRIKVRT